MPGITFADIEPEFTKRVQRIVWCTVATIDTKGRPRTRILHPIWEGATGWIWTNRHSLKEKHLAGNPHISLTYWDPQHHQVYVEGTAVWEDDPATKARVWERAKSQPAPYGYDPAMIWPAGSSDPEVGLLRITPRRIELSQMTVPMQPKQIWRV